MKIPPDWDLPSEGNDLLTERFEYGTYEKQGIRLPYRLYTSDAGGRLPLVIYLHGADAMGNDNETPLSMHDIGTVFVKDEWQALHPCHILAPQSGRHRHWSQPEVRQCLYELITEVSERLSADGSRIYIYGYSAGGIGTLSLIKDHPELFAGAIPICAATGGDKLEALTRIPIWLVHAADDSIVKVSYSSLDRFPVQYYGSREIYNLLKDKSDMLKYTEYPEGYMKERYGINAHCTWVCVSDPEEKRFGEWMFEQRRR